MKQKLFLAIILSSCLSILSKGQEVQATISQTSTNSVMVKLKSNATFSGQITAVVFTLQVPNTLTPRPTITIKSNPLIANIPTYTIPTPTDEGGFYTYLFSATTLGSPVFNFTNGVEVNALELQLSGSGTTSIRLSHLPSGGTTFQAALYVEVGGNEVTNFTNTFYGSGVVNGGSYTSYSYVPLAGIVLPTKFTAFSATKKDNDGLLNFVVENETSITEKYEVEKSLDGTTFEKINTLAAVKNGAASNVYNVVDANLANTKNNGIIYYRIKQIDTDGKTAYTEIRSIRMVEKGGLSAFPNPVQDYTNVRIDVLENTEITLTLVNAEGKQVMTKTLQAQKGTNLTKLDMSPLAAGNYLIKAMVGAELKTISVIKL